MSTQNNIISNPYKEQVRQSIEQVTEHFQKQIGKPLTVLSLPAIAWVWEKRLLDNPKLSISEMTGVENHYDPQTGYLYPQVLANAPKGTKVINAEFDTVVSANDFNVIWADYCGNPAEEISSPDAKCYRYGYPHIATFVNKVATGKPMIYFLTFCCNGRIKGGKVNMMLSMAPNAKTMTTAIRTKMSQMLCAKGLTDKVTEILRIEYKGGKRSHMVTFGFAVNFVPDFPRIKLDWMEQPRNPELVKNESGVIVAKPVETDYKRKAVHDLADKGWSIALICQVLDMPMPKVRALVATHLHPESFKK